MLVDGVSRARLIRIVSDKEYFLTEVEELPEPEPPRVTPRLEALIRQSFELFNNYSVLSGNVTAETVLSISTPTNPGYVADYITQNIFLKPDDKQRVLETMARSGAWNRSATFWPMRSRFLKSNKHLSERLHERMARLQKDNVLREQLRVIQAELGEGDEASSSFPFTERKFWPSVSMKRWRKSF